jgi:MGT family glycosyltransferase
MKSRHIAVFTHVSNAHVYPVMGLCSELARRGHRVTVATNAHYAPEVREAGGEPVIFKNVRVENIGSFLNPSPFNDRHFWTIYGSIIGPIHLISAASALPQIEGFYRENRPDLILDDRLCHLGRMLAARLECPAIQVNPHFAPYDSTFARENGIFTNPEPMLAFSTVLDCFLRAYGITQRNNLWHVADLNICFIPREFQVHGESFDERFCFVGPCLNRPARSVWTNNGAGRPVVLVSGSQADNGTVYFRAMIEAFSGTDFFVVLSPGADVPDDAFGSLPSNFEINRRAYNFQILSHAALAISQGGTGTVMESMYHGVPILVVPRMPVHAETAFRVAELGLGDCLPENMMSVEAIRESVARILRSPEISARVARMQQIVRTSGGAELAATRIERFIEESNGF